MTSIADSLMERRAALITQATEVAQRGVAEGRDLTGEEQSSFDKMIAEAEALATRAKAIKDGEDRAGELEASFRSVTGREAGQRGAKENAQPLGKWAREARVGDSFELEQPANLRSLIRGDEQRAMSATGGVSANGVSAQLWEYAIEASQILQSGVDLINTTDGNTLPFPVATVHSETSDTPVSASGAITEDDATITLVNSTVAKYGFLTFVPTELVQDATFDLDGYIARSAGRELGRRVSLVASTAAIAGYTTAGTTAPAGVLTNLGTQTTVGQGTDLLYKLFHSVLPEYRTNASWMMADPTAALVRVLKGSDGQSVWQPALTAGDPDLLVGKPVYIVPQIAVPAANAKSIFFGDMSSLVVRIAGGMRFERSNEYKFANDQVSFRGLVRAGAVVLDPNAVKHLLHPAA